MTTAKRKAQLREAQRRSRAKKRAAGWKQVNVPPELLKEVMKLLKAKL